MAVRNRSASIAVCLLAAGLVMPGGPVLAQSEDAPSVADAAGVPAGTSVRLGNWRIHHIEDLRLGQPTLDPKTGAIYHPVAITGTSISFYVIGAGEQELWEVPIIWAGTQPTGNRFHRLDYFGILEDSGSLYIYSRETE
ncbi:hypothetical protein [Roseospira navarrensis]|uniref:Uncharacterized protein n=1 Tax=Roseospira navarrensis TaxID=140058 RepID=A0A7X1ZDL9_9PROT|nr:hypothetical protein [Roseospira navarrensis]MQX36109.1 hypothetical protein [Roseospira navarrensis]